MASDTWQGAVLDELKRSYQPGESFTLQDFYAVSQNKLQDRYPQNEAVKATIRRVLQQLRDRGLVDFESRGSYIYRGPAAGRDLDTRLTEAVGALLAATEEAIGEKADDYFDVAVASDLRAAIEAIVTSGRSSPTFMALKAKGRLDLTFERLVLDRGGELRFGRTARTKAQARLDYFERS